MADTPIEDALSIAGTVCVVFLLLSQLPTLFLIYKRKLTVADVSVLPSLGQGANFVTWVLYGIASDTPAILRVNVIGCAFALVYILFFLSYSVGANRRQIVAQLTGTITLIGIVVGIIFAAIPETAARADALGWVAVSCNVLMLAAPLAACL